MRRILFVGQALAMCGLLAFASDALAQGTLSYFDAQIVDFVPDKGATVPANTIWADGTAFTPDPFVPPTPDDPMTPEDESDPGNPSGNWTANAGFGERGQDGLWNRRDDGGLGFGNPGAHGIGTVFESRGGATPNDENLPTLATTVDVPASLQTGEASVWAIFWNDVSSWQIAASLWNQRPLLDPDDDMMPVFTEFGPAPYVLQAYNVEADAIANDGLYVPGASVVASGNRLLFGAYLGSMEDIGPSLTVYAGDGPPLDAEQVVDSGNHRAWYDGIAIGDASYIDPDTGAPYPPRADSPEPTSIVLLGLAFTACGFLRRR